MKHAGPAVLATLEPLLEQVRKHTVLRERKLGAFYYKSKGFLHFHEDPAGIFADVKLGPGPEFVRLRATTRAEQRELLTRIAKYLDA
jgi:hypothetical protein